MEKIPITTLKAGTEPSNRAWGSLTQQKKFLQYLRKEQSFTENRIARIRAGDILPVNAKVERHRQRLQQLLNHYKSKSLLSVLEGLLFNFDF